MIRVLYGEEPYLIEHTKKKLLAGIEDYAISVSNEWNDDMVMSLSMSFCDKKAILIKGPVPTKSDKFKALVESDNEDESYIIIFIPGDVDFRTTVVKSMEKLGMLKNCRKFEIERVRKFISGILADKIISVEDMSYLINRMGYYEDSLVNLYTIEISAKKLSYCEEKEITRDIIKREVPENVTSQAFVLFQYLVNGQMEEYFSLYDEISRTDDTIGILSILLRSARIGYKASLGFSAKDIGVHTAALISCKNIKSESLLAMMECFQNGCNNIKSGMADRDAFIKASLGAFNLLHN